MLLKDAIKKIISEMSDEELWKFISTRVDNESPISEVVYACPICPYGNDDDCLINHGPKECQKANLSLLNSEMGEAEYAELKNRVLLDDGWWENAPYINRP